MNEAVLALLPDDFRASLELLPENEAITLLTRHSIREEPDNYNGHYKLPLTQEGRHLASFWGSLQPFESFQLFSSPVGRCVETAERMFLGKHQTEAQKNIDILPHLAEPGCFIKDRSTMEQVGRVFIEHGPIQFLESMLTGSFDEHISTKESIAVLLQAFQSTHNQNTRHLNIHVSHDTILAAFVYSLLGKQTLEESDWPRMMEGVYLWFDDEHVHGIWRAELFTRKLDDFLN